MVTLYAEACLEPGSSVGRHVHEGTMEVCLFTGGKGKLIEKDVVYEVGAGDVGICFEGEMHETVNDSDEPLTFIALVLNTSVLKK